MKMRWALLPFAGILLAACQTPVEKAAIPPNDPRYYGYQEHQKPVDPNDMGTHQPPPPPPQGNNTIPAPPPPLGSTGSPPPSSSGDTIGESR